MNLDSGLSGEACRAAFTAAKAIARVIADGWGIGFLELACKDTTDPDTAREVLEDTFGPLV